MPVCFNLDIKLKNTGIFYFYNADSAGKSGSQLKVAGSTKTIGLIDGNSCHNRKSLYIYS